MLAYMWGNLGAGVFAVHKKGVYKFLQYGYYLPETRLDAGIVQEYFIFVLL